MSVIQYIITEFKKQWRLHTEQRKIIARMTIPKHGYGYQPVPGSSNSGTPPCVRAESIARMSADGSMSQAHLQARLDILFKMLLSISCPADISYWSAEWKKLNG